MIKSRGGNHLGHGIDRVAVKVVDALGLVGHDEASLELWVLSRHAHRAPIGVASLAWMQPTENMKPRAELTQSAPRPITCR